MHYYEDASRSEVVKISFTLNKSASERHSLSIQALSLNPGQLGCDDTLYFSYTFRVDYYGDVLKGLAAVNDIASDPSVVREVKVEELIHGRSVILEVAAQLTRLIDKLEGNQCPKPSKRSWWQRPPKFEPGRIVMTPGAI